MIGLLLDTKLDERQRHYAEIADERGRALSLINDILTSQDRSDLEMEHIGSICRRSLRYSGDAPEPNGKGCISVFVETTSAFLEGIHTSARY